MSWLAVALGGAIGAVLRYALSLFFVTTPGRFPLATFIANGAGCFLMGLGFIFIVEKGLLPYPSRQLFMVGMLGALTTFSTFSLEVFSLIDINAWRLALTYALLSLFTCLVAVTLGVLFAKSFH